MFFLDVLYSIQNPKFIKSVVLHFYSRVCSSLDLSFAKSVAFNFYFTIFSPLPLLYQSKGFPSIFSSAFRALILKKLWYSIFVLRLSHLYMFLSIKRFSLDFFKCIQNIDLAKFLVFNFYFKIFSSLHVFSSMKRFSLNFFKSKHSPNFTKSLLFLFFFLFFLQFAYL